jgi:hypothetical protein
MTALPADIEARIVVLSGSSPARSALAPAAVARIASNSWPSGHRA